MVGGTLVASDLGFGAAVADGEAAFFGAAAGGGRPLDGGGAPRDREAGWSAAASVTLLLPRPPLLLLLPGRCCCRSAAAAAQRPRLRAFPNGTGTPLESPPLARTRLPLRVMRSSDPLLLRWFSQYRIVWESDFAIDPELVEPENWHSDEELWRMQRAEGVLLAEATLYEVNLAQIQHTEPPARLDSAIGEEFSLLLYGTSGNWSEMQHGLMQQVQSEAEMATAALVIQTRLRSRLARRLCSSYRRRYEAHLEELLVRGARENSCSDRARDSPTRVGRTPGSCAKSISRKASRLVLGTRLQLSTPCGHTSKSGS